MVKISTCIIALISILLLSCTPETTNRNIVVYGDSRPNDDRHRKVIDAILRISPDVVFHVGDLVNDGNIAGLWGKFNEVTRELREVAEFYPAAGNHEQESPYYYDNFVLPNNEKWYSVEIEAIHFVVLNSNLDLQIGSEQYLWLSNDLANIGKSNLFIIVLFHHPIFASGPHIPDEKGFGDALNPLFEQYGVDIVFNGHNHLYERSLFNGIYHVVTGGGGTAQNFVSDSRLNPYSEKVVSTFHFCTISMENSMLIIEVFDTELNRIDKFFVD